MTRARGGHSGYPKISDRVFRVFEISGSENCSPRFPRKIQNPTFRVPENSGSGSGNPEQPDASVAVCMNNNKVPKQ
jgi:hypothetical protein